MSLNFVRKYVVDNVLALVKIMYWHRTCDKPLPEPLVHNRQKDFYAI